MNPLQQASYHSARLITERLAKLDQELETLAGRWGDTEAAGGEAVRKTAEVQGTRYTDLPKIELPPQKKTTLKPQITAEYTQTLQHAPELMSLYEVGRHEAQYLSEAKEMRLPPRVPAIGRLLSEYLDDEVERTDPFQP